MQQHKSNIFSQGKSKQKHVLILAKGNDVRHMIIQPWVVALIGCICAVMLIGHLGATTYLVVRDDLIGSSMARQARIQHAYEDKIALLRHELDRATSRQLLNQQLVQDKVAELMQRQNKLSVRHGQLSPILDRAGIKAPARAGQSIPIPAPLRGGRQDQALQSPDMSTSYQPKAGDHDQHKTMALATHTGSVAHAVSGSRSSALPSATQTTTTKASEAIDDTQALFGNVALSLKNIEHEQIARIQQLADNTNRKLHAITDILKGSRLPQPALADTNLSGVGGPYIPPRDRDEFTYSLRGLDKALENFDRIISHVQNLPIVRPVADAPISSHFGHRQDPFFKRRAFHAGIDFKAKTGTHVRAVANGRVVAAGRKGGYGKMVEIDHGNGLVTRYAHLSRILVKNGDYVSTLHIIGKVGSTGRSTGPHLHYEIRRHGNAVNPASYIDAGTQLQPLLHQL